MQITDLAMCVGVFRAKGSVMSCVNQIKGDLNDRSSGHLECRINEGKAVKLVSVEVGNDRLVAGRHRQLGIRKGGIKVLPEALIANVRLVGRLNFLGLHLCPVDAPEEGVRANFLLVVDACAQTVRHKPPHHRHQREPFR